MKNKIYNKCLDEIDFISSQVVFPRISSDEYKNKNYKNKVYELVEKGVGGFCVFSGEVNETSKMIYELQNRAKIPLIFCADFENGLPMRLVGGTEFPHSMALGISNNTEVTYEIAKAIAGECKQIGIHWNLAPVADINSNKTNPIINIRAFGETAELVSSHVVAYINGLQSEKVVACAKHFPGHGDTSVDSHLSLPVLNFLGNRIRNIELKPFQAAINNNVKSIMVGHLAIPAFDSETTPASLSKIIIENILRNELTFDGIVVSDALDMKSITSNFSNKDAVIKAIEAGCNVLLLPPDPDKAIDDLIAIGSDNESFRQKLISSAARILNAKEWTGLLDYNFDNFDNFKDSISNEKLALKTAYSAVKVIGNNGLLPLPENGKLAGFAFVQDENLEKPSLFFKILAQAVDNDCDFAFVDDSITNDEIVNLINSIGQVDFLIFSFFYKSKAYYGTVEISNKLKVLVNRMKGNSKSIAIFFGNPYLEEKINCDTKIVTYSDSLASIAASILFLSGRKPF